MTTLDRRTLLSAAALYALAPPQVFAQASGWSNRPVRFVVPFAAGGTTDIVARMISQHLTRILGTQLVVDNRPGANGILGSDIVAKAPGDGHTMLIVAPGHASNVSLYKKLPYDTLTDFEPVSLLLTQPSLLVVHPSVPVKNLRELLKLAKESPGSVTYGSGGSGSSQHLAMAMLADMAGVELTHVPYRGSAPAEADLLGGQVKMMFASMVSVLPQVRGGRLKALAVSSPQRSAAAPDIPTMAEAGVPGYAAVAWAGLLLPKGTPASMVITLNAAVSRIMNEPDVKSRLGDLGAEFAPNSPADFNQFIRAEIDRWSQVIQRANLKVD